MLSGINDHQHHSKRYRDDFYKILQADRLPLLTSLIFEVGYSFVTCQIFTPAGLGNGLILAYQRHNSHHTRQQRKRSNSVSNGAANQKSYRLGEIWLQIAGEELPET